MSENFKRPTDAELIKCIKHWFENNPNKHYYARTIGGSNKYKILQEPKRGDLSWDDYKPIIDEHRKKQREIREKHLTRFRKLLTNLAKGRYLKSRKEEYGNEREYMFRKVWYEIKFEKGVFYFKHPERGQAKFNTIFNRGYVEILKGRLKGQFKESSLRNYFQDFTVGNTGSAGYRHSYSYYDSRKNMIEDIRDIGVYGDFLCDEVLPRFANYTSHAFRNLGMILPYLYQFENMYNWKQTGIKIDCLSPVKPNALPKQFRKWFIDNNITMTKTMLNRINEDVEFFKHTITLLGEEQIPMLKEGNYGGNINVWAKIIESENLFRLVKEESYDLRAIIRYLFNYILPYEQLSIKKSLEYLRDYASMHRQMDVNDFKKYPKYLVSMHDIIKGEFNSYQKVYKKEIFQKNVNMELSFKKVRVDVDEQTGKKTETTEFVVEVPQLPDDLKNEGKILSHCVGSYIERVMKGETQIIFLRKQEGIPMVTLEVRGKVLIQARGYANRGITKEEQKFIKTYAKEKNLLVRI